MTRRRGDDGTSALPFNRRVPKNHARLAACGDIDEACSQIGLARAQLAAARPSRRAAGAQRDADRLLRGIQLDLFAVGAEAATENRDLDRLAWRISGDDIARLEKEIARLSAISPRRPRGFVIPGGCVASATLDVARTVIRRAERSCVALKRRGMLKNTYLPAYLNRLSNLVWLLARLAEKKTDVLNWPHSAPSACPAQAEAKRPAKGSKRGIRP